MAIKIGTAGVAAAYLGTSAISRIYRGADLVFESEPAATLLETLDAANANHAYLTGISAMSIRDGEFVEQFNDALANPIARHATRTSTDSQISIVDGIPRWGAATRLDFPLDMMRDVGSMAFMFILKPLVFDTTLKAYVHISVPGANTVPLFQLWTATATSPASLIITGHRLAEDTTAQQTSIGSLSLDTPYVVYGAIDYENSSAEVRINNVVLFSESFPVTEGRTADLDSNWSRWGNRASGQGAQAEMPAMVIWRDNIPTNAEINSVDAALRAEYSDFFL